MRKRTLAALSLGGACAMTLIAANSLFAVQATEAAVVLSFGRPVRVENADGRSAGLYAKWPFVEQFVRLDRRELTLAGDPRDVSAEDGARLSVQGALRYRVVDPARYYREVELGGAGNDRLRQVLDQAVAQVAGGRTTQVAGADDGRFTEEALAAARRLAAAERLGVAVDAVSLLSVQPADREAAISDMQRSEALRAAGLRNDGEAARQASLIQADREAADVRGEGEAQALVVRGQGDAERAAILGEAYGKDPEFARFFRRIEAYDQALSPDTTALVLSPDANGFLDLFGHGPAQRARGAP
jgi:modulator of FtsH protease HflC